MNTSAPRKRCTPGSSLDHAVIMRPIPGSELSSIDPWFLDHLSEIVELEEEMAKIGGLGDTTPELLLRAKQNGFSDHQLSQIWNCSETEVRHHRLGPVQHE